MTRRSRAFGSQRPMQNIVVMKLLSHHPVWSCDKSPITSGGLIMQVFITGGTGLIGSAVVAELLGAGHTVLALTRSEASAAAAQRAGAVPVRGELGDLAAIRAGVERSD